MKKENVFESDMPTMEMETQTLRQTQHGQPVPVVGGIPINPYTGFAINPGPGAYPQQQGYGNFNGFPTPMMPANYAVNPVINQMQPSNVYGGGNMNPVVAGGVMPGHWGTGYNAPYWANHWANQYQGAAPMNPVTPWPGQWNGAPTAQPMTGQYANVPATPFNTGVGGPVQSGTTYQQAINVVDGQYMLVPNLYPQGVNKNGNGVAKNGERDFVSWVPNVNILETDRSFKIEVCVPGVTKENCHMYIDKNNVLRVSGARRWNQETEAVGFTRKDFNYGSFACSFLLPEYLLKEKITSSCRSGLLIISIPKKDSVDGEVRSSSEILIS